MSRSENQSFRLAAPYGFRNEAPESGSGEPLAFKWRDEKHQRYNKRFPDSVALLDVQTRIQDNGNQWASIRLEELYTDAAGRSQSRVISVSLDNAARLALIAFLQSDGIA